MLILGPKMTHFPHFGHNNNFPLKSQTLTCTHFSMPVIRHNFRKIYGTEFHNNAFEPKNAHLFHFEKAIWRKVQTC